MHHFTIQHFKPWELLISHVFSNFLKKIYLFEREEEHACTCGERGRGRGRGTEDSPLSVEPGGAPSHDPETTT